MNRQLLYPFRLSLYLSLALACICLGYAEADFLPETTLIMGFVGVLLFIAYSLEGRWALTLTQANIVGIFLALSLLGWIIFQVVRPPIGLSELLPWPASLLPYLGPILMILIPTKLFRTKHVGDYWAMQGLGLMAVALACAMANEGIFGFLLVAYFICFVWSLVTFYLSREAGLLPAIKPTSNLQVLVDPPVNPEEPKPYRWWLARMSIRWAFGIAAVGFILFLASPRSGNRWELAFAGRGKMETGISDGPIDLNRTGSLTINREKVFEVEAKDIQGHPKKDLPWETYWRVSHVHFYESGKWVRDRQGGIHVRGRALPPNHMMHRERNNPRPDFGPDSYQLTYTLVDKIGQNLVLHDPVMWRSDQPIPIWVTRDDKMIPWVHKGDGTFEFMFRYETGQPRYTQITMSESEPGLGPRMVLERNSSDYLLRFPSNLQALKDWTSDLLKRLIQEGRLPKNTLDNRSSFTGQIQPKFHEQIAREFEKYLASSGEFTYSLELKKQVRRIDPAEDFIFNTKAGHCQRFASALALMLRSQGIPSQVVLGYRGCESQGDGIYEVREDHAHAWVEVLIQRPNPPSEEIFYHWLRLDPTPGGGNDTAVDENRSWFDATREKGENFFKDFILGYNSKSRERIKESLALFMNESSEWVQDGGWFWLLASLGGLSVLWYYRHGLTLPRRKSKASSLPTDNSPPDPLRSRLFAILKKAGFVPRPDQTAWEFAQDVRHGLKQRELSPAIANIPNEIVDAYYRVRFGLSELTESERTQLSKRFQELEAHLEAPKG